MNGRFILFAPGKLIILILSIRLEFKPMAREANEYVRESISQGASVAEPQPVVESGLSFQNSRRFMFL